MRGERGSSSVEMVIALPIVLTVLFLAVQAGTWFHARSIALASAQSGARTSATAAATRSTPRCPASQRCAGGENGVATDGGPESGTRRSRRTGAGVAAGGRTRTTRATAAEAAIARRRAIAVVRHGNCMTRVHPAAVASDIPAGTAVEGEDDHPQARHPCWPAGAGGL